MKKNKFDNFNEYNIYLVKNLIDINFIKYIEDIHFSLFNHIKIDIFKYLLSLHEKSEEFCIDENILEKYNLIIKNNDKKDINALINNFNLKYDIDYRIRKKIINNTTLNEYKFNPNSFKKCLIKTNDLFIDIYLILDKCVFYYDKYQFNLKNNMNAVINYKLDNIYRELKNNKFISILDN